MELEEQSGVDTCQGDSEKICWPLVQAGEELQERGGRFGLRSSRPARERGGRGLPLEIYFWREGKLLQGGASCSKGGGVLYLLWRRGFEAVWRLLEEQLLEGGCRAERLPETEQRVATQDT